MIGSRFEKHKVLTFDERVDPATSALIVIDVQNDFALPQGACGKVGDDLSPVAPMVKRLNALIETARKANVLIVFVRTLYDEPVMSPSLTEQYIRRGYPNSICLSNTPGAEFFGGLGPRDTSNEILVTKHRYSAFWGARRIHRMKSSSRSTATAPFGGPPSTLCFEPMESAPPY
jgi:ureidoacrylate peracid hydrolase